MTAKDIYESVCMIYSQGYEDGGCGTGFFVMLNANPYLVTNKHVLLGEEHKRTKLTLFHNVQENNQSIASVTTLQIQENAIIAHDKYDLALYPVEKIINCTHLNNREFNNYIINSNDIETKYDEFDYIEPVIIAGFPCQFRNKKTNRHLLSHGITTTPLFVNLDEKEEFLIDIPTYKCHSGSPIFVISSNSYKLIGIVRGSLRGDYSAYNINIENNYQIQAVNGISEIGFSVAIKSSILTELSKSNMI